MTLSQTQAQFELSQKHQRTHELLKNNLYFYARNALKIFDKSGNKVPLTAKPAQRLLQEKCEEQLKRDGRVRLLVPKSRKEGVSTWVGGRYFHKAVTQRGRSVYIMCHESSTTAELFSMVKTFEKSLPKMLKPLLGADNKNTLEFIQMDSKYKVATARTGETGRGSTPLLFHGSEVAFWMNAESIRKGVMSAVPDNFGTEIILESTGNGPKGMFYDMTQKALKGKGSYEVLFLPWYEEPDYTKVIPKELNFVLGDEEAEIEKIYNLTNEQIYWRRCKMEDYRSESDFKQEFPISIYEVFQYAGDSLVSGELIEAARRRVNVLNPYAPVIMGIDPAPRKRSSITIRQGDTIVFNKTYEAMAAPQLAFMAHTLNQKFNCTKIFIDLGYGAEVLSTLINIDRRYAGIALGLYFAQQASVPMKYGNIRAEMADRFKAWMETNKASIPDTSEFAVEVAAIPDLSRRGSSMDKLFLPSKAEIIKEFGISPDIFDSTILTFAFEVKLDIVNTHQGTPLPIHNQNVQANTSKIGAMRHFGGSK